MDELISLFDYIFYRICEFFREKGDNVPETKGALLLSLIQCFTIIDVMVVVKIIHDYSFPNKFVFLPVLAVIYGLNWYRYERSFDLHKIKNRWKDEDERKRIRNGWFIGLYMLLTFLTPPVYGYLNVNLKVI